MLGERAGGAGGGAIRPAPVNQILCIDEVNPFLKLASR